MNNTIFRKKSIDKVSSPEQLNDYIRVANPGVWLVLGALIILLVGICVWGVFGNLNTTLDTVGKCENGTLLCYVNDEDAANLAEGLSVTVDGLEYKIESIDEIAVKVENALDEYFAYRSGFSADQWVYAVIVKTDLPDGYYDAEIVIESVSPISFVLN